jgi:hypothetical protein
VWHDKEHLVAKRKKSGSSRNASRSAGPTGSAGSRRKGSPLQSSGKTSSGKVTGKTSGKATRKTPGKTSRRTLTAWKPGSEAERAADVGSPRDFGAHVAASRRGDRDYVSRNTKRSDRGAQQPFSHERTGERTSGAVGRYSGTGSSSGGDLDTDIVGVGTGGSGVSQAGPDEQIDAAESDGTSNEFASPVPRPRAKNIEVVPARRSNQGGVGKVGGSKRVRGSVVRRDTDVTTWGDAQGADAATNPIARAAERELDDSFAAEVSSGESRGEDLPVSPSQDTQGMRGEDDELPGAPQEPAR